VTTERISAAAITSTIAPAIQRPGRRTGTALMSSGRPVPLVASGEDTSPPDQLVAPLIFGVVMAPDWMPHLVRICR
jgi:hypothetical protein